MTLAAEKYFGKSVHIVLEEYVIVVLARKSSDSFCFFRFPDAAMAALPKRSMLY